MKTFRVTGALTKLYYMDVAADSGLEAYDIAESRNTEDWFEIETDNTIELVEVYENEE
jgi:hypothetical protein